MGPLTQPDAPADGAQIIDLDARSSARTIVRMAVFDPSSSPGAAHIPCHKRVEWHHGIRAGRRSAAEMLAYRCDTHWYVRIYDPGELPDDRVRALTADEVMWSPATDMGPVLKDPAASASRLLEALP